MDIRTENGVEVLYRYKYLPFNEGSLKMLTEGTMKFTCPLDFNDPFDCMPAYDLNTIDSLPATRPDLIQLAAAFNGVSFAEAQQVGVASARKAVESGDFSRGIISTLGVSCLSRNPASILMWSHYADHHKGFVVELRIPMDAPPALLDQVVPFPVDYRENRPMLDWTHDLDVTQYFLTKSPDWKYEQEERILTTSEGPGIHPYSRHCFLHSVIAGGRISPENYQQLIEATRKASSDIARDIPVYRAELARDKYKVYVPGHPNPEICQP